MILLEPVDRNGTVVIKPLVKLVPCMDGNAVRARFEIPAEKPTLRDRIHGPRAGSNRESPVAGRTDIGSFSRALDSRISGKSGRDAAGEPACDPAIRIT
jgi:hypothetical protein